MPALLLSRRDLDFLLHEWLDVTRLTARERFAEHSRETFDAVLELGERIAADHFAPHNKANDANEPRLGPDGRVVMIPEVGKAVRTFAEAGLIAGEFDEELGGMQLPNVVSKAVLSFFHAANVGTAAYPFLTIANANLLVAHGSPEQVDTWVRPMMEGRFLGTMCLSEPQVGSSLADIATRAEPQPDGTYRLTGTKMWISAGEHDLSDNIVHLVLAKIPGGPPGVKGISLFIVPKVLLNEDGSLGERNDIALVGLNHKMGYRGTVNTVLNFGEGAHTPGGRAGAVGYLVGEPHKGLAYMFSMMNEARVGVGLGATALGYTGYLHALEYAKVRLQGRPVGAKDPATPPVPLIEHADVRRMLLAQKSYVEGGLALGLYCSLLVDEERTAESEAERERAATLLDVLTPIAKSWPSQWCLEANSLAIQVHGGYGYTREYNVEQFYRDNRLNPIHEGTHGIQGLDLLGRKVVLNDGAGLRVLGESIAATVRRAREAGGEPADMAEGLQAAFDRLAEVTVRLWSAGDVEVTLANSSVYLEAAGHIVVAWMWLEQVLAAHGKDGDFYTGKRQAARYFFRYELPRTGPQLDLLASLDRTTLDMDPAWF
ncbi:acyl-CoA dehydrogenase [Thermomonospora cellulosilytica]|uniref:Alkylation response protein AidB-like acyl-CoA dehydrogenase n=1 Tax=Thermomonospora cellulosilytica TaxID=1411118 RepID=A0A7W3MXX0_9ACTN|nr:acyl-CoA dehydrogenase [Thermomonospora cellulosilytica]MBA9003925.1 alkylation response protein AidB-like acyl-CoA dehydrogenase [Thermomonospora cellulosilytica]